MEPRATDAQPAQPISAHAQHRHTSTNAICVELSLCRLLFVCLRLLLYARAWLGWVFLIGGIDVADRSIAIAPTAPPDRRELTQHTLMTHAPSQRHRSRSVRTFYVVCVWLVGLFRCLSSSLLLLPLYWPLCPAQYQHKRNQHKEGGTKDETKLIVVIKQCVRPLSCVCSKQLRRFQFGLLTDTRTDTQTREQGTTTIEMVGRGTVAFCITLDSAMVLLVFHGKLQPIVETRLGGNHPAIHNPAYRTTPTAHTACVSGSPPLCCVVVLLLFLLLLLLCCCVVLCVLVVLSVDAMRPNQRSAAQRRNESNESRKEQWHKKAKGQTKRADTERRRRKERRREERRETDRGGIE